MRLFILFVISVLGSTPIFSQSSFWGNYGEAGSYFFLNGLNPTDGGYVGVATSRSGDQRDNDVLIYYLNEQLEVMDSIQIERPGIQVVRRVVFFPNGSFIVAGTTDETPLNRKDIFFWGFAANGTMLWEQIAEGFLDDNVLQGKLISDESAVFVTHHKSGGFRLMKLNTLGEIIFIHPLEGDLIPWETQVIPVSDDNFIIVGNSDSNAHASLFDNDGNLVWSKDIEYQVSPLGFGIEKIRDIIYDENQNLFYVLAEASFQHHFLVLDEDLENVIFGEPINIIRDRSRMLKVESDSTTHFWIADSKNCGIFSFMDNELTLLNDQYFDIDEDGNWQIEIHILNKGNDIIIPRENGRLNVFDTDEQDFEFSTEMGFSWRNSEETFHKLAVNDNGDFFATYGHFSKDIALIAVDGTFQSKWTGSGRNNLYFADIAVLNDQKIVQSYASLDYNGVDTLFYNIFNPDGSLFTTYIFEEEKKLELASFYMTAHITPLQNGGFLSAYENSHSELFLHALKISEEGELIDTFDLSAERMKFMENMITLSDGNVLMIGSDMESNSIKLIKLNPNGEVLWNRTYGMGERAYGVGLSERQDGERIALSGIIGDGNHYVIYWAEIDQNGNLIQEDEIDENVRFNHSFIQYNSADQLVINARAHNLYAIEDEEEYAFRYWKLDDGNIVEDIRYYSRYPIDVYDTKMLPSDQLVFVGSEYRANDKDAVLAVLDANGQLTDTKGALAPLMGFDVSPNPSKGLCQLTLDNDYRGKLNIQLLDINGRIIFTEESQKLEDHWNYAFNRPNLPTGSYLVRIMTKEGGVAKLWQKK